MKIVVAPDTFKGSLSAKDLCAAISSGISEVLPEADIIEIPMADGGEGTVESLVEATRGKLIEKSVTGPLGKPIKAVYGVLGNERTAVVEVASGSGLPLVPNGQQDPMTATSYGTGELIHDALNRGFRDFIIGLGGSATNDGGKGMLRALGLEFLDEDGIPLPEGGGSLVRLASIDESGIHPALQESTFTVACDVDNVLCGPQGASAVFGPQKGATPEMVPVLDSALSHYADIVMRHNGMNMKDIIGGGAAGGIGAALVAFMNARLRPGVEIVMQAVDWEAKVSYADYVITGEGKLDNQTLSGKTIKGICNSARQHGIPVIALAGSVHLTEAQLDELGAAAAFSIVPGPASLEAAMQHTEAWIRWQTIQIFRIIKRAHRG